MDDLSFNFLYLQSQYSALHRRAKEIRHELTKNPQHVMLTAELERVKHDTQIISALLNNVQGEMLATLENELGVKFQWLKRQKEEKKDNGLQVGK